MDSTRDWGATPSMPLDPSPWPWPAMSDAIQVPCTPQEALDGGVFTPERLGPSVTEPARSDTEGETPLSMTATSTPWPWVTGQADGACTMSSTHICWSRTASARAGATLTAHSPVAASATPASLAATRALSTPVLLGTPAPAGPLQGAGPPCPRP